MDILLVIYKVNWTDIKDFLENEMRNRPFEVIFCDVSNSKQISSISAARTVDENAFHRRKYYQFGTFNHSKQQLPIRLLEGNGIL